MSNHTIDLGGELHVGDMIGVSYSNSIEYGWYVPGRESLMFVRIGVPSIVKNHFQEYQDGVAAGKTFGKYLTNRYAKGLTFKCMSRDFITAWGRNRVFKIDNPEEFFKGSKIESAYLEAKAILNDVNFPAK